MRLEGKKGNVWEKVEPEGYGRPVDLSNYMLRHRFETIKKHMSYLFADERKKGSDPWWQLVGGIDGFN